MPLTVEITGYSPFVPAGADSASLLVAALESGDFHFFLARASGYGTVGLRDGQSFLDVRHGTIEVRQIRFCPEFD